MTEFNIGHSDFRTQIMTIKELLYLWNYQNMPRRASSILNISRTQRSRHIEAILIGMPLQSVFVDDTMGKWDYISGGERIQSYVEFCNDAYPLSSLYFKEDLYGGLYFSELSNLAKQKILTTQIQVFVLNPGLTRQERFGIYICLKTRLDSETLRSCRKKIYPEYYYLIEDMANEVIECLGIRIRNNAYIENEICHLLALANYRRFLNYRRIVSLDFAANDLLGTEEIVSIVKDLKYNIVVTLSKTRSIRPQRYGTIIQDIYNAVCLFTPRHQITEELFLEAYRNTNLQDSNDRDDVATISNRINSILNYIKNVR